MGAIQSALQIIDGAKPNAVDSPSQQPALEQSPQEQLDQAFGTPPSYESRQLQAALTKKFSNIELLSLRQGLAAAASAAIAASTSATGKATVSQGLNLAAFTSFIGLDPELPKTFHEKLFHSFCNLSTYPDCFRENYSTTTLHLKDLIKPLAIYCNKAQYYDLNQNPIRVLFESFAQQTPVDEDTLIPQSNRESLDVVGRPSIEAPELTRTKTMEDTLKDLTKFEWDPEDDDHVANIGSKIQVGDLVDIIDGLLALTDLAMRFREQQPLVLEKLSATSPGSPLAKKSDTVSPDLGQLQSATARRMRARGIVEQMLQYQETKTKVNNSKAGVGVTNEGLPLDWHQDTIDFDLFWSYIERNGKNLFAGLQEFIYGLFLIGNTMLPPQQYQQQPDDTIATTTSTTPNPGLAHLAKWTSLPALDATTDVLNPEDLTLLSWFLPPKQHAEPWTSLYSGTRNGFSMNQFDVHVCKYPAPTVLVLLLERRARSNIDTISRRKSISFGTSRPKSGLLNTPPASSGSTWSDYRRSPLDKITEGEKRKSISSPPLSASNGSTLNSVPDDQVAPTAEPNKRGMGDRERLVIGAYVTEAWRASKSGWGNENCSLFELSPNFEVFPGRRMSGASPPKSTSVFSATVRRSSVEILSRADEARLSANNHFIHFHKDVGIGFGGHESEACMLFLDNNLRYGSYKQDFAGGNVYASAGGARQAGFEIPFEVVECEVWGLGGDDAKAKQKREWDFEHREANRRASIQLRGRNGEQDIDRDLLEMAGVLDPDRGHRHARRQSGV